MTTLVYQSDDAEWEVEVEDCGVVVTAGDAFAGFSHRLEADEWRALVQRVAEVLSWQEE